MLTAKRHELVTEFCEEDIWVDADVNRIGQVISNLLTNAAKYTPEGGKISLSVNRFGQQAVIRVTDNGIGIDEADLPHIFDMFTQIGRGLEQAQGGLGIGLNLVKRLIEKHGGTVSASSLGHGQGCTFTLQLPAEQRVADVAGGKDRAQFETTRKSLRIVLADDNVDAAFLIRELLEMNGHTVNMARDGVEALHAIRQFLPDVVLLDIGMPAMNGYDVAKARPCNISR